MRTTEEDNNREEKKVAVLACPRKKKRGTRRASPWEGSGRRGTKNGDLNRLSSPSSCSGELQLLAVAEGKKNLGGKQKKREEGCEALRRRREKREETLRFLYTVRGGRSERGRRKRTSRRGRHIKKLQGEPFSHGPNAVRRSR